MLEIGRAISALSGGSLQAHARGKKKRKGVKKGEKGIRIPLEASREKKRKKGRHILSMPGTC
jgi:hypothetical protein